MAQKPSIPKGTRDFLPAEMVKRNYIFETIKEVFRLYGFQPIETPAMENLSTLMGKYGEEGDKLLFKILDSGDYLSDFDEYERNLIHDITKKTKDIINKIERYQNNSSILKYLESNSNRNRISDFKEFKSFYSKLINIESNDAERLFDDLLDLVLDKLALDDKIYRSVINNENYLTKLPLKELKREAILTLEDTIQNILKKKIDKIVGKEKGLRYDLTVPTARFVVQYQNEITFPFKRYQIQPVWRADRPQKGRYREFYQCDVDVIGSNSLLNEVELVQIISDVFTRLKIDTVVKINNRKILSGIAEVIGENQRIVDITVAIDKLEKIGLEKVNVELAEKGVSAEAIEKLQPILALQGGTNDKIDQLEQVLAASEIGLKGVAELRKLFSYLGNLDLNTETELDLTLARGLNYYTGAIFEVKAKDAEMGSICGGGRYDDLTGIFGLPNVSGVGVSFGAERIYDVLTAKNLFPAKSAETTKVLFVNFGTAEEAYCLPVLAEIRKSGINAEIFPDSAKMQKQMTYANKKAIPFVVLAGESEIQTEKFTLKNMTTGEQSSVSSEELINILLQN